ncbi:NIPSNAP family protein [Martelella mediterranea]|uniref:NIPSNAP domain-containing protein n=1 Tax=Martelella mediterranea DSM 17316 TaxID=1122214 RepID=A0A1U9YVX4_9HYPH|nr:NIPSNAP family protein [Martelella mediterranea]AQZ49574.1 hypothetical protein Mame_00191 [Martelella mediterranea DSM 17316]
MIIDHRIYTLPHGKTEEYLQRYGRDGLPVQQKYLDGWLGCYVSEIGPLNQVLHLWAYESMADREQRRNAVENDPQWIDFKRGNIGTFAAQETRILKAAPFTPATLIKGLGGE